MRELGVHVQATRSINAVWSSQRAEWHRWGGQPQKGPFGHPLGHAEILLPFRGTKDSLGFSLGWGKQ